MSGVPQDFWAYVPNWCTTPFSHYRRTTGSGQDTYGDATFSESLVHSAASGHRGVISWKGGQTHNLQGKEVSYDTLVITTATFAVGENDILLLPTSTSTAVSTRYHVRAVKRVYRGPFRDHTEIFAAQEVL